MFASGHFLPFDDVRATSALPPISTAQRTFGDGRKVPQADIRSLTLRRRRLSSFTLANPFSPSWPLHFETVGKLRVPFRAMHSANQL